jgi:hypothetical protein
MNVKSPKKVAKCGSIDPDTPPNLTQAQIKEWKSQRVDVVEDSNILTRNEWETSIARHILSVFATSKIDQNTKQSKNIIEYVDPKKQERYLSFYLIICLSKHLSIDLIIHLSINLIIHLSVDLCIYLSIDLCIYSISKAKQRIDAHAQAMTGIYLCIYLCIYLSYYYY